MVLFSYILLGHEIEHYHCYELLFAYCNPCNLNFSSIKLENGLKKHVQNVARIKYGFAEFFLSLFLNFLPKSKRCSDKIVLIKKECIQ